MTDYYGRRQYTPGPQGMLLTDKDIDPSDKVFVNAVNYNYNRLLDAINHGNFTKVIGLILTQHTTKCVHVWCNRG